MRDEARCYIQPFPASGMVLGTHFKFEQLAQAAYILCERAGCDMKTFDYEGVIEDWINPVTKQRERAHFWSALRKTHSL